MYFGARGGHLWQLWDLSIGQEGGMGVGKEFCDEGAPRHSKGAPHSM